VLLLTAISAAGVSSPAAQAPETIPALNGRNFGAKGDGFTLDTAALNKAIMACAAAGGGTVYVPPGTYLSGTVHLKSKVTLFLEAGATILGSRNLADYYSGDTFYAALLQGVDLENTAIVGHGTIDGNNVFNSRGEERIRGPHGVRLLKCRDFTLRDITIKDAGNWATAIIGCTRGNIQGITALGGSDAINMQYTRDVTISNCRLFTGDDSLAGAMWQNVTVTNCIMNTACHAVRLGGQNVVISNCLIYGPARYPHRSTDRHNTMSAILHQGTRAPEGGLRPGEDWRRPTASDNLMFTGITMRDVRSPFYMESRTCCNTYPDGPPSVGLKKIFVDNLTAIDAGRLPFGVDGHPESPIESILANNLRLSYEGGITEKHVDGYSLDPASGFLFKNVDRVALNNVRLEFKEKDARPILIAENVRRLELRDFIAPQVSGTLPQYVLENVGEFLIDGRRVESTPSRIRDLRVDLSRTRGKAIVGEPFNALVGVESTGGEGLARIELGFDGKRLSRTVWLQSNSPREVLFANLRCSTPGEHRVEAGGLLKTVVVAPVPARRPISPPYLTFANVKADFATLGDETVSLVASEIYAYHLHMIGWPDRYAAAYLRRSLPQHAAVTVRVNKVELPDYMKRFDGRTGIMVRNDIAQPDRSAGYVVLDSSISYGGDRLWSNGWSMQWDSNGDGHIDQHTVYAGYTLWPHWLKLERHGNKYSGYYSLDRETWNKVGEVTVPGAEPLQDAGMYVTWAGGKFSDFKITKLNPRE
jgi:hypothetical protein